MISDRTRFGLAAVPFFAIAVAIAVGVIPVPHAAVIWTVLIAAALGAMFAGLAMGRRDLRAVARTTGAWRRTDPPARLVRPRRNIADRDVRLLSKGYSVMTSGSWQDEAGQWRLGYLVLTPGSRATVQAVPLSRGRHDGATITGPFEIAPLTELPPVRLTANKSGLRIVGADGARMNVVVPQVDTHLFGVLTPARTR